MKTVIGDGDVAFDENSMHNTVSLESRLRSADAVPCDRAIEKIEGTSMDRLLTILAL